MWAQINATEWKRDPDELKSAKIILEEFSNSALDKATGKKPLYTVESIPLPDVPRFTAIAFCLPNILREVAAESVSYHWTLLVSRKILFSTLY
jgi:hypothetical protein